MNALVHVYEIQINLMCSTLPHFLELFASGTLNISTYMQYTVKESILERKRVKIIKPEIGKFIQTRLIYTPDKLLFE